MLFCFAAGTPFPDPPSTCKPLHYGDCGFRFWWLLLLLMGALSVWRIQVARPTHPTPCRHSPHPQPHPRTTSGPPPKDTPGTPPGHPQDPLQALPRALKTSPRPPRTHTGTPHAEDPPQPRPIHNQRPIDNSAESTRTRGDPSIRRLVLNLKCLLGPAECTKQSSSRSKIKDMLTREYAVSDSAAWGVSAKCSRVLCVKCLSPAMPRSRFAPV